MLNRSIRPEDRKLVPLALRFRHSLSVGLFLLLVGCAPGGAFATDCTKHSNLPPSENGEPRNISGLKSELLYYQCSGAYERDIRRVIDEAIAYISRAGEKTAKPALVLDIDETSLSNWDEMKANNFGLIENGPCNLGSPDAEGWKPPQSPCGFNAWVLASDAKPLDTVRLYRAAKANHVSVFFITARKDDDRHSVRDATGENLRKAGYSDWADLILEPGDYKSTVQQFKTEKRKEISAKGYTIIANVGDQYSDLNGGYANKVFKLPNPFYFVR